MNCKNCNKQNDDDSNFCKHCGDSLRDTSHIVAYNQNTIFGTQNQPGSNNETGYFIIALITMFNVAMWFFWTIILRPFDDGSTTMYSGLRVLSIFLTIAQFVIMFIFTSRLSYRIVIGIIAAFVVMYDVFWLAYFN